MDLNDKIVELRGKLKLQHECASNDKIEIDGVRYELENSKKLIEQY